MATSVYTSLTDAQSSRSDGRPAQAGYRGLVVLIPTRNRSDLAIRAIRSTLDAPGEDRVRVLVSDNSTEESEIAALGAFCQDLGDPRVQYIRPPGPLRMAEHWEWGLQQALDLYDASHLTLLADRRIYHRGGLHELCDLTRRHPDSVIVSPWDDVLDHVRPIRVVDKPWSGRLLELRADDLLRGNAQAQYEAMVRVPTQMISIIPRRLFGQVRERFGDYCLSIAPDYCFGYRVLDIEDTLWLYDKPMTIALGMGRSNGFSFCRGVATKDKLDFISSNGGTEFHYWATPCPEVLTGYNGVFHEYNFVRTESRTGRFPELDLPAFLRFLHSEVSNTFEDPDLKERYLKILAEKGYRDPEPQPPPAPLPTVVADEARPPRSLGERFRAIRAREPDKPLWRLLPERLAAKTYWSIWPRVYYPLQEGLRSPHCTPIWWTLYKYAGIPLPSWLNDRGFSTVDEAIEFLHGRGDRPTS